MLNPQNTYIALLVVQAFHLLHHRLAKRHISFAEVVSAVVLCVPPWAPLPGFLLMGAHFESDCSSNSRQRLDKEAVSRLGRSAALISQETKES